MLTQLNPAIPVTIAGKDHRKGYAIGWIDYSQEHHLLWIVALDDTGEVWVTPNDQIRLQGNWSMGRTYAS